MRPSIPSILCCVILQFMTSCLQEIRVKAEKIEEQLVVQGSINTSNTTHKIRLFSTIQLDNIASNRTIGENASVKIVEIGGPTFSLTEVSPSLYETGPDQLIATPGKSYQLQIELSNGDKYQSEVETIPEPIHIISSRAILYDESISQNNKTKRMVGHELILELENTEKIHYFSINDMGWAKVAPTVPPPSVCWSFRKPIVQGNPMIIGTNELVGSKSYSVKAVRVPADQKMAYVAILEVNSMSESSHLFWKSVNTQLNRSGSIFDAPVAPIIGNMSNSNGNKIALGYFHVYATSQETICFTRENITGTIPRSFSPCTTTQDIQLLLCN